VHADQAIAKNISLNLQHQPIGIRLMNLKFSAAPTFQFTLNSGLPVSTPIPNSLYSYLELKTGICSDPLSRLGPIKLKLLGTVHCFSQFIAQNKTTPTNDGILTIGSEF